MAITIAVWDSEIVNFLASRRMREPFHHGMLPRYIAWAWYGSMLTILKPPFEAWL